MPRCALLAVVVLARAGVAWGAELAASRSSARAKSQLRGALLEHIPALGLDSAREQRTGELAILATRGIDALDGYFSLYLPQLFLAVIVPVVVIAAVLFNDWISAAIIAFTIPLIPMFMALVGATTRNAWTASSAPWSAWRPLPRRRRRAADPEDLRPCEGPGGGNSRDHRALSHGRDGDAADHLPVLADPRARRDGRGGARGGGRSACD